MTPKITFKFSKEQKYQMEHLHYLSSIINDNLYDMFMYIDDDDTYHTQRVETFIFAFEYGKENIEHYGGIKECSKNSDAPEYWAYGTIPSDYYYLYNDLQKSYIYVKANFISFIIIFFIMLLKSPSVLQHKIFNNILSY